MNKKSLIISLLFLIAIITVLYFALQQSAGPATSSAPTVANSSSTVAVTSDLRSIAWQVAGAPAQYFGNEATGDLNGDGQADKAFLVTQDPGGSGTFYYVIAALKTAAGYQEADSFFLGDRIAPQTTEIRDGELIVNYAKRRAGEPMTTPPSVGASFFLKLTPAGKLVER